MQFYEIFAFKTKEPKDKMKWKAWKQNNIRKSRKAYPNKTVFLKFERV